MRRRLAAGCALCAWLWVSAAVAQVAETTVWPSSGRDLWYSIEPRTDYPPAQVEAVFKTALAEGLAQRIVAGDVPQDLIGCSVLAVDMGLLIAGAKYRGEFEQRLKAVMEEVIENKVIVFIDELHALIGGVDPRLLGMQGQPKLGGACVECRQRRMH